MKRLLSLATCAFVALGLFACSPQGAGNVRPDIAQKSDEEHYADFVRGTVEDVLAAASGKGETDLASALEEAVENLSEYEGQPVGEYEDTYKAISETVSKLADLVEQGKTPGDPEVKKNLDTLKELVAKLPGGGESEQ